MEFMCSEMVVETPLQVPALEYNITDLDSSKDMVYMYALFTCMCIHFS